jgi:hypothetical protein
MTYELPHSLTEANADHDLIEIGEDQKLPSHHHYLARGPLPHPIDPSLYERSTAGSINAVNQHFGIKPRAKKDMSPQAKRQEEGYRRLVEAAWGKIRSDVRDAIFKIWEKPFNEHHSHAFYTRVAQVESHIRDRLTTAQIELLDQCPHLTDNRYMRNHISVHTHVPVDLIVLAHRRIPQVTYHQFSTDDVPEGDQLAHIASGINDLMRELAHAGNYAFTRMRERLTISPIDRVRYLAARDLWISQIHDKKNPHGWRQRPEIHPQVLLPAPHEKPQNIGYQTRPCPVVGSIAQPKNPELGITKSINVIEDICDLVRELMTERYYSTFERTGPPTIMWG